MHTIELLASQTLDYYDKEPELAYNNLKYIESSATKGLSTITKMMNMLDDVQANNDEISLQSCLSSALKVANIPDFITLGKNIPDEDIILTASEIHITEVMVNLLRNAIEAIELAGRSGEIFIQMWQENSLAVFEVHDNGTGIKKSDIRKIFSVLFSTKQNQKNWGIGLSYVKKVIDIYNGYIYVKSIPNNDTCFQIIIPTGKEDI